MATHNDFTFVHDERDVTLVNQLPPVLKPIYDFRAMCNSSGIELDSLYAWVRYILDSQFIKSASSEIIAKWEKYLSITPNATDTLDERKFRVLTKLNDSPPYTDLYLEKRLNELCGEDGWRIFRDYDKYTLTVQVSSESLTNNATVIAALRELVPANIKLVVGEYRVRHNEMAVFTHAELGSYTHNQIKYKEIPTVTAE